MNEEFDDIQIEDACSVQLDKESNHYRDNVPFNITNNESDDDEENQIDHTEFLKPTGAQVQKGLKYFDLGLKLEIILFEFQSLIFWTSIFELFFFVLYLMLYVKVVDGLGEFFFSIPHPIRGIAGIFIHKRLPRSHHIISQLKIQKPRDGILRFDTVKEELKTQSQAQFF